MTFLVTFFRNRFGACSQGTAKRPWPRPRPQAGHGCCHGNGHGNGHDHGHSHGRSHPGPPPRPPSSMLKLFGGMPWRCRRPPRAWGPSRPLSKSNITPQGIINTCPPGGPSRHLSNSPISSSTTLNLEVRGWGVNL